MVKYEIIYSVSSYKQIQQCFAVGHCLCKNKYFRMDYSWLLGEIYQKQIKTMI